MNDNDKSLIVRDEQQQSQDDSLGSVLGGWPALIMLVVMVGVIYLVFAFPTPGNPAATDGAVSMLATAEPTEAVEAAALATEDVVATAVVVEPTATLVPTNTLAPTEAPTNTPVPTEPPTNTPVPTEPPTNTPAPTEAPTEADPEPTEDVVAEAAAADEDPVAAAIAAADVDLGIQVFNETYNTSSGPWICASCHSVDESVIRLVGPGQWGLYERAEERILESGDPDVVTYIRNSIVHPNDYIVPGDDAGPYPENLMPMNYGDILTDEELDAVVAYVLTLGNPDYEG